MKLINKSSCLFLLLLVSMALKAQSPQYEMRSVWLATVWGLDWPRQDEGVPLITSTGNVTQINAQKKALLNILDSLAATRMNAICFQVRSRCDAMYKSSYEPWSTDLVSQRGMDPGYDPLEFIIEEAHKRGMELHAWINPYRFESVEGQWSGMPGDYKSSNPDWVLSYGGMSILNPGLPEVRERVTNIIKEIVSNYDVDGILFDDYFYAEGITTEDAETEKQYNTKKLPTAEWRRENVNTMVKSVYDMIQQTKSYVRFGIGPAGIWDGSSTAAAEYGLTLPEGIGGGFMYNKIYCDPLAWLKEGTIDYVSPQIYWTTNSGKTDYNILAPWWSDAATHFGKHIYISHTLSSLTASNFAPEMNVVLNGERVSAKAMSIRERESAFEAPTTRASFGPEEIGLQIEKNRESDKNNAPGSIFYSARKFYRTRGFMNYLRQYQYTHKALVPAINWKKPDILPNEVTNITLNTNTLSWSSAGDNVRYAIYAFPKSLVSDPDLFRTSQYLMGISYGTTFQLPSEAISSEYTYAVAVYDRFGNIYTPVIKDYLVVNTPSIVSLAYPENNAGIGINSSFSFQWSSDDTVNSYYLEIAADNNFSDLVCSRELYTNSLSTDNLGLFKGDRTYYWRVVTKKTGAEKGFSEIRSFNVFGLSEPLDKDYNLSLTPKIAWTKSGENTQYKVEISKSIGFEDRYLVYSEIHSDTECVIPRGALSSYTIYYIRVSVESEENPFVSQTIKVRTEEVLPDRPVILSPLPGDIINGGQLKVVWKEDEKAIGFRVELCDSDKFPSRRIKPISVDAFVYEAVYEDLEPGEYYLRMNASSSSSETPFTEWSDTIKVFFNTTSIEDHSFNNRCYIITGNSGEKQLVLDLDKEVLVTVSLYSVDGSKISSLLEKQLIMNQIIDIPVNDLHHGYYLLWVEIDDETHILKFIN